MSCLPPLDREMKYEFLCFALVVAYRCLFVNKEIFIDANCDNVR